MSKIITSYDRSFLYSKIDNSYIANSLANSNSRMVVVVSVAQLKN